MRVAALFVFLVAACTHKEPVKPAEFPKPIQGPVDQGGDLIGTKPPPLDGVRWLDGKKHPLSEDKGKVVLVRWWTSTCPLCANSAPAVAALKKKYGDDLAVRAIFHEKPAGRPIGKDEIEGTAKRLGFPGLIGHDPSWPVLDAWWLDRGGQRYTSVTFLLDREGKIRLIHTGGEFHTSDQVDPADCVQDPAACEREYEAIDTAVGLLTQ